MLGAYRMSDGTPVSIRQSGDDGLRLVRFSDGVTERYTSSGGQRYTSSTSTSPADRLTHSRIEFIPSGFAVVDEQSERDTAQRIDAVQQIATIKAADGVLLYARLTLPAGDGPHPAVILAHGSGDDAATRTYRTADLYPLFGIASLVYDKRGTGASGGTFTMDFELLANDLVAAADWLTAQPVIDETRIGVSGYSQGGWIGPLAASKSQRFAFVIANFGMIDSPRDEARLETLAILRERALDDRALAQADRLNNAAIDIVASNFSGGWDEFHRLLDEYADEPWIDQLDGTVLDDFVTYPEFGVRLVGPFMADDGLPWDYTSMSALDELAHRGIPSAWLIAEEDSSAPPEFTLAEIRRRAEAGEPVHLQTFPDTDHGFVLFEVVDGQRIYGNYHPQAYVSELNWARRFLGLPALESLSL